MNHVIDPDAELDAWWDAQVVAAMKARDHEQKHHRCPSNMPPCPDCQAKEEEEHDKEYESQ